MHFCQTWHGYRSGPGLRAANTVGESATLPRAASSVSGEAALAPNCGPLYPPKHN